MSTIQLSNMDTRLLYLALHYHLARPGSELNARSGPPATGGLGEVAGALEKQLSQAVATIELGGEQRERLLAALGGAINELKAYPLLEAGGRSTVPGFADALRRLFPEVAEEPEETLPLAGHMLQLRRRLAAIEEEAPSRSPGERRPWWRFWERGG